MFELLDHVKTVDNEANTKRHEEFGDEFPTAPASALVITTPYEDGTIGIVFSETSYFEGKKEFRVSPEDLEFVEHEPK